MLPPKINLQEIRINVMTELNHLTHVFSDGSQESNTC